MENHLRLCSEHMRKTGSMVQRYLKMNQTEVFVTEPLGTLFRPGIVKDYTMCLTKPLIILS